MEMTNLCQLKELKLSCMGCCGNNYGSRKKIEKGLLINTDSYNNAKNKKKWGKQKAKNLRSCGICHNLVQIGKEIFCPLHPERNNGKDLRDSVCDKNHFCKTLFKFKSWNKKQIIC